MNDFSGGKNRSVGRFLLLLLTGILVLMLLISCTEGENGSQTDPDPGISDEPHPIDNAVWQHMGGPPGGRGYDVRHKWDEPSVWYVTDTFSGVSISRDDGKTWTPSNQGMNVPVRSGANDVYSLTVDPNDPQIIWAGTTEPGHIYKSTDGGRTWSRTDNKIFGFSDESMTFGSGYGFRGFTVELGDSKVVYAQAHVFDYRLKADGDFPQYDLESGQGGRIFKTDDGGKSWRMLWEGRALARNLVIDPRDVKNLWATTGIQDISALDKPEINSGLNCGGAGLLHSTDGGKTWQELGPHVGTPGMNSTTMGTIDMSPIDPDTIIVGGGSEMCPIEGTTGNHGGVYLTHDGGVSWELVLKDDIISSVDFCDINPEYVYAVSKNAFYKSMDGGHTWSTFTNPSFGGWGPKNIRTGFPIDTETDPDDCERVLVNTYTGGVFLTTDGGKSFRLSSEGYSGSFISGVWVDPQDAGHVIVSSEMAPFERVVAGGSAKWKGLLKAPLMHGTSMLAASASFPRQPADLLVANPGKIVPEGILSIYRRTTDGGWQECIPELLVPQPLDMLKFTDIQYAPNDSLHVYAATAKIAEFSDTPMGNGAGLFYSTDGGSTWTNSVDYCDKGFLRIAVDPKDSLHAWAVGVNDVGVVVTEDGGLTWTAMDDPNQSCLNAIAFCSDSPEKLWIGGNAGLMVREDGAWVSKMTGLPELSHISVIALDPAHPDILYVGTFYNGVFYSTDAGATFQRLDTDLPRLRGEPLCIEHIAMTADGSVVYAGGHSAGLWRLNIPWE